MKDKLKKITSSTPSAWKDKAKYRIDNPWLREYSSAIARRVIAIMKDGDENLNQTRLAEKMGVKRQQVSKILSGKENLELSTIWKLSKALKYELITFPPYKYSRMVAQMQNEKQVEIANSSDGVNPKNNLRVVAKNVNGVSVTSQTKNVV